MPHKVKNAPVRLKTRCTIYGRDGRKWTDTVIIDSGAPNTCVDRKILCYLGASPSGEYCAGVHGGIIVPKGYGSIYKIDLGTSVSARRCMRVYASKNPEYEARVLLGMDWLQEANPTIDWRKRVLTPEPSKSREETITLTAQDRFAFDSSVPESFGGG
jgi:hypothetical protein